MHVPLPPNEQERLQKLSEYGILDTAPEKAFDDIVRLAAQLCGCPVAAVTLVDRDRLWVKSISDADTSEIPRGFSFCAHTILHPEMMHVADAALDPRFCDSPFVANEPHIRFYAGAPLVTAEGQALGALCVIDFSPRELSPEQRAVLEHLSRIVMMQLDLRRVAAERQRALSAQTRLSDALQEREHQLQTLADNVPALISRLNTERRYVFANKAYQDWLGVPLQQVIGRSMREVLGETAYEAVRPLVDRALAGGAVSSVVELNYRIKGRRSVHMSCAPERGAGGEVTGIVLSAMDVTEQRQAEDALKAGEAKYRRLAESGVIGVITWRPDGGLTGANDKFLDMTGYTRADFEAGRMRWNDMTPPEWKAGCAEAVCRLSATGVMGPYQKEFFRRDGSRVPVLIGGALLEDGTGGISFVLDLTERQRAEASLNREQERFRLLAEGLGAGLLMTDLDDTIQYANPRMAEITGYSRDEMNGRSALALLLSPAEHEAMRRNNRDRSQGISASYELRMRRRDGSPLWLEVHAVPFRDEQGRIVGTLSTNIDITERVQTQEALRESEQRRRLALSGGHLGWWDLDLTTGRYREFSDQCKAHFGLPPDASPTYSDFVALLHPDDRVRVEADGRRAMKDRQVYATEYRVVWPDGSVHWLSVHGTPVQSEAGRMIGVTQEVTERRLAEESLRERTEVLESVLSTIPHQVFWKDRRSIYLGCNANFARAAGLDGPADIVGRTDADLPWTPDETEAYRRDDLWVMESGVPFLDQEEGYLHNDGTASVGLTSKLPLHDSEGQIIGLLGVSQDITERKALEADRERLLSDTEFLLAEAVSRADCDPLTGLLNHRAFHRRLQEETDRAQREGTSLSMAVLDLDNFKFFNDAYGHLAGDDVLRRVAEGLRQQCRSYDTIARFGGDEFAVLMPGLSAADAACLTRRALDSLGGQDYVPPGCSTPVPLSLSAGVAVFPADAPGRLDLLTLVDERLRLAKSGGDEVVVAAISVREEMSRRIEGFTMLDALVAAVDNKDRYTRRHSEGVLAYSLEIARELGLDEGIERTIAVAALLHDVGKIGVPDAILRKPGKLTDDEFEAMKQHPMMGAVMVGAVPGFEGTLDAVRHHHERWDGQGYPFGLRGEETPLIARLLAVADAFSAMTTDRPYRKGLGETKALAILAEGAGTQWDPACVQAFRTARQSRSETSPPASHQPPQAAASSGSGQKNLSGGVCPT